MELPITQVGYGESDPYVRGEHDLYALDFKKPVRKATRIRDTRYTNGMVNETRMRKHGKVYHVTEYASKPMKKKKVNDVVCSAHPKPIDEDLYKISPQLVRTTKRKKLLGFISKCLVLTACVS